MAPQPIRMRILRLVTLGALAVGAYYWWTNMRSVDTATPSTTA